MKSGKSEKPVKLVAIWLAVLGLTAAVAGSCSVNHRSADFACQQSSDCSTGRTCVDGLCVSGAVILPDAGARDARPQVDALVCPSQCTSCDAGRCTIDCAVAPDACNLPVACPAGWDCNVKCSTDGSCRRGVDCNGSTTCTVSCTGARSCQDVTCGGGGACKVDCGGFRSCTGVTCGTGACNVDCTGSQSCSTVTGGTDASNINCSGPGTCSNVDCASGACAVACGGVDACTVVDCGNACACDVACQPGSSCAGLSCAASGPDGCQNAAGCTSQRNGCNTCP